MTIHKEGYPTLIISALVLIALNSLLYFLDIHQYIVLVISILSLGLWLFLVSFFRNPKRPWVIDERSVIAPADGKVVVIEEVEETEYFKDKRIQVSIFMSPLNVHINRYPIAGEVKYAKYHPGKYLVAWHPKSSTENERTTVVVENENGPILFRQIAGALAKRIVMYAKEGNQAEQTQECGFIKFGSRVDVFLPLGTKLNIQLNEMVSGGITKIASLAKE